MKTALISVTENGRRLSEKISEHLSPSHDCIRYTIEKYSDSNAVPFGSISQLTAAIFGQYDALVYICACGIAVRMIAPHIVSKLSDPAVIAIDEQGKFAVSLLSGHIGGANALASRIADILGATAVITTATDVGGRFSPDSFAAANHLHIVEMGIAKTVAAAVVNGQKIGLYADVPTVNLPVDTFAEDGAAVGICISSDIRKMPFETTLHLVPKDIIIGVGCKRNTDPVAMEAFILDKLREHHIPLYRVSELHTIDLKKNESAVVAFCEKHGQLLKTYPAQALMLVTGTFDHSDFVQKTTGANNICERSAAADGGQLIIRKQKGNGMTFAAAQVNVSVDFERQMI